MFKNFFNYESKFYQFLLKASNIVLLNVLYLLCCLPVITIGAAQAGMMNATRIQQDPEDDTSWVAAFFRGFTNGFGRITLIWCILMVVIAAMIYLLFSVIYLNAIFKDGPVISAILGLAVVLLVQSMATAFHSRFDCSVWQVLRSSVYMILMHPIRAVLMAAVIWGPVIVLLLDLYLFLQMTPLWMFFYFGIAWQFAAKLMYTPFRQVEEQFFPDPEEEIMEETE